MKRNWFFLINPFLVATLKSFSLASKLSTFTDTALHAHIADATILAMYNIYHPLHLAFQASYNTWDAQLAIQMSNTDALNNLLDGLSLKFDTWEYAIRGVYAKGSSQYNALIPHGKMSFTTGSQASRLQVVNSLNSNLLGIAALAATKSDVNSTYTALLGAFNTQKDSISTTNTNSSATENQRVIICNGLYSVLGKLMDKFNGNPTLIGDYIDLEIMHNGPQTTYVGHVAPNGIKNICKRTRLVTDEIKLSNKGTTALRFYISSNKKGIPNTVFVDLGAGNETTVTMLQLGDANTEHYIMVQNQDTVYQGAWEIQLL
ncbi:MAG: hypothetical protein RJA07_1404 [Bacteroidota bacterium]|jgi:hypothetical protein